MSLHEQMSDLLAAHQPAVSTTEGSLGSVTCSCGALLITSGEPGDAIVRHQGQIIAEAVQAELSLAWERGAKDAIAASLRSADGQGAEDLTDPYPSAPAGNVFN